MTEQFIPYEEALALKKLGFDEPCLMCYIDEDNKNYLYLTLEDIEQELEHNNFKKNSDFNNSITAPLWQQAFDWFKKEHNLHGNPQSSGMDAWFEIYTEFECISEHNGFLTYAESRLECLRKLIKIKK